MKPLLTTIAFISLLAGNCTAQSDSAAGRKHYPIKSCRIVFRFFNGPQSGTKMVIFDDWGNKEKEEAVTMTDNHEVPALPDNFRIPPVQHNLKITVERQSYAMDLDQHIGVKSHVYLRMGGSMEDNLKQMGFAFVRTDTLLGKLCKVWEQSGAFRLWVWKDFYVIKKQMIQAIPGGMRLEEYPTEIDEAYSIKPDEFKIPDNIHFQ